MRRGPTLATLQKRVDAFNAEIKIGDAVNYASVKGGPTQRFNTRSEAEILSGHTAVVWLEGKSGCVDISHCEKVAP